jgi:hypothetical protein
LPAPWWSALKQWPSTLWHLVFCRPESNLYLDRSRNQGPSETASRIR